MAEDLATLIAEGTIGVQRPPTRAQIAEREAPAPGTAEVDLQTARAGAAKAESEAEIARLQAREANLSPEERRIRTAEAQEAEIIGKAEAEARAEARLLLPQLRATTQSALDTVTQLLNHPGFSAVVGVPDPFKGGFGFYTVPASEARGAAALLEQVRGQAFLQAFETLKGAGQITEREGEAATAAITRMQSSLSEADFKKAAQDFMDTAAEWVRNTYVRATRPLQSETMRGSLPPEAPEPEGMANGGPVRRDLMSLRERYNL